MKISIYSLDIKYNGQGFWLRTATAENGVHYLAELDKSLNIACCQKKTAWDTGGRGSSPRSGLYSTSSFIEKEDVVSSMKEWLKKKHLEISKCLEIIKKEGFKKPEAFKNGIFLLEDPVQFYYDSRFYDIFYRT